jgi:hypothetical protein
MLCFRLGVAFIVKNAVDISARARGSENHVVGSMTKIILAPLQMSGYDEGAQIRSNKQ